MGVRLLLFFFVTCPSRHFAKLLPIFFMHGLRQDRTAFNTWINSLRAIDPDVVTYSFNFAERDRSMHTNLWKQGDMMMDRLRAVVNSRPSVYEEGYTLACHSQGALLCRTVVQRMDDHNVHTLLALAGPQAGIYGKPSGLGEKALQFIDPTFFHNMLYTSKMQYDLSFANYWHDPRDSVGILLAKQHPRSHYLSGNTFLPVMNNNPHRKSQGPGKPKNISEGARYKANFLRLKMAVFTCGYPDNWIVPPGSGCFSFYDPGMTLVPLERTTLWSDDWIGLQALNASGRLQVLKLQGVTHGDWHDNSTVLDKHLYQYLPHKASPSTTATTTLGFAANISVDSPSLSSMEIIAACSFAVFCLCCCITCAWACFRWQMPRNGEHGSIAAANHTVGVSLETEDLAQHRVDPCDTTTIGAVMGEQEEL